MSTVVQGAYGRSYKTIEDAKKDWKAGKDFKIVGGPYCSIRDFDKHLDSVIIMLNNNNDVKFLQIGVK